VIELSYHGLAGPGDGKTFVLLHGESRPVTKRGALGCLWPDNSQAVGSTFCADPGAAQSQRYSPASADQGLFRPAFSVEAMDRDHAVGEG